MSFLPDGNGSLIHARAFLVKTATLDKPAIITRRATDIAGDLGSNRMDLGGQGPLQ